MYLYKLIISNRAIVRVKYTYMFDKVKPNEFDLLATIKVIKNTSGDYQIESQQNESFKYRIQLKN